MTTSPFNLPPTTRPGATSTVDEDAWGAFFEKWGEHAYATPPPDLYRMGYQDGLAAQPSTSEADAIALLRRILDGRLGASAKAWEDARAFIARCDAE